ncbi:MAG: TetR/AcrR family transcriptional regulator [Nocardioidaceae bacterium]
MSSLRNSAKEAHIDAAKASILDIGWRRTTLTEVARRAGVSRMTIYRHWDDRERLLADLMTREWVAILEKASANSQDDQSLDGFIDLALSVVEGLRRNPLLRRILELDPEMVMPYILQRTGRSQKAMLELLEARIRLVQANGQMRAGRPVLARTVALMLEGLLLSRVDTMKGRGILRPGLIEECRETLMRGLSK